MEDKNDYDRTIAHVNLVESSKNRKGVVVVNTERSSGFDNTNLVELARQIQKADEFTRANAISKLGVIADQIRFLQSQARQVLEDSQHNADLHHVACNFKKQPGNVYYLYRRDTGTRYISLLSPKEWGSSCPHEYLGAYKLEHDMSWTPESRIVEKGEEIRALDTILQGQLALPGPSRLNEESKTSVGEKLVEELAHIHKE